MGTNGAPRTKAPASKPSRVLRAPKDLPDDNPGSVAPYEVGQFVHDNLEMYYEVHGSGPRVLVFLHGILMDANMNRRLASDLAAKGNRVILLDLPGHGLSARPQRASFHRMDTYADHVVALLDHLGIDEAVVGGVSLGGNVSLLVAAQAPERVRGLVIEMPVLEWALPAAAITFVPMLLATHFARPVVGGMAKLFRSLPRSGNGPLDSIMNMLSAEPRETAAVLHGILAGPIAPTVDQRAAMEVPALVIGHKVDHVHPFHDAQQLARRLPQGQLIQASSVLELRVHPERLTEEINLGPLERRDTQGREATPGPGPQRPPVRPGTDRVGAAAAGNRLGRPGPRAHLVPAGPTAPRRGGLGQSSKPGRRDRLRSDSLRFSARRRSLAPLDGRVGRRALSMWSAATSRSRRRSTASCRFRSCDRSSSTTTLTSGPSFSRSRDRW